MEVGLPVVYVIIALIVILAAVVIYGAWSRKKIYRQIDELESWKIEIMNRPVTDEIAKLKQLKMVGETEEKFETWRNEWDDIVTVDLPNAEEKLFEAEEAADKYKFSKAREVLTDIRERLSHAESRIEALLKDLQELVTNEQQNRKDIVSVKEAYHEAKKQLLTERRFFQKAVVPIENQLQELDDRLKAYEIESEDGNYTEARKILLDVKERLDVLKTKMKEIPGLFTELQTTIPEQIKELRDGYRDMMEQGYVLDHLVLEDEVAGLEGRLESLVHEVEELEVDHPREEIKDIESRLDMLYSQLEQEVASRRFVLKEGPAVKGKIAKTDEEIAALKEETDLVSLSYRIEQEDLAVQEELETEIDQLKKRFSETEEAVSEQKQAFSMLSDKLKSLKERLVALEEKRTQYKEVLKTLREDELKAKETLVSLRKRLVDAKRMVQKSNLPGIPYHHLKNLESAEEKIAEVDEKLNEKPLEMVVVNQILNEALKEVDDSFEQTKKVLEDAALAERLIQYGNRYRSRYPVVREKLAAAESSFRNYHYEEALELAATGVETVEPDILKKFDVSLEDEEAQ
jgi:septation ring formation regulator